LTSGELLLTFLVSPPTEAVMTDDPDDDEIELDEDEVELDDPDELAEEDWSEFTYGVNDDDDL